MAGFHSESILFAVLQSLLVENLLKKKKIKTLKSRQLERAAGLTSCVYFQVCYITDQRNTDDTVTLKNRMTVKHNIHKCTFKA